MLFLSVLVPEKYLSNLLSGPLIKKMQGHGGDMVAHWLRR